MRFYLFTRRSKRLRLCLLACVMATLIGSSVHATIMQYLEVEDLTRLSTEVVHGQVISTEVYWNPERTRIYTGARVRVSEAFKGASRRDQIVTITQLGGELDGIKMDYAGRPEFSAGETVVVFAAKGRNSDLTVVGLKQGKMRVESGEAVREFSGITLVDRPRDGRPLQPLGIKSSRIRFDELRNRVMQTR